MDEKELTASNFIPKFLLEIISILERDEMHHSNKMGVGSIFQANPGRFARGSFRRVVSPWVVSPLFYGWVDSPLLGGSFRP